MKAIVREHFEEQFFRQKLKDYETYTGRVRHRLLPYLWWIKKVVRSILFLIPRFWVVAVQRKMAENSKWKATTPAQGDGVYSYSWWRTLSFFSEFKPLFTAFYFFCYWFSRLSTEEPKFFIVRASNDYIMFYFIGGAFGSFLGAYGWSHWRWSGVCLLSLGLLAIAAATFLKSRRDRRTSDSRV